MGERTSYPNGTFSWVDNVSSDTEGAKRFYGEIFGWGYDDRPAGNGATYSMALVGDKTVAAIAPQQQDEISMGIPPHWNNYVTVDDLDATAARVNELGGNLVVPPFHVMKAGNMAVLIDPTGAVLCLWEAGETPGARLVNTPGSFTWNDLTTRDPETAKTFYGELFGWEYMRIEQSPIPYWVITINGRSNGGIREMPAEVPAEVPAHWLPYFGVNSIDEATEKCRAAGGDVWVEKAEANAGNYFAALRDPAGAAFAIFEGTYDD